MNLKKKIIYSHINFIINYRCHMNVEICASINVIKYLIKYTIKGPDVTQIVLVVFDNENIANYDEILHYESKS